jgi:UDP-N-acetylmuramyl tripeptide synthase
MNVSNVNVRITNNNAVYVDYSKNGKALNAAFMTWADFIKWLSAEVL